MSDALTREIAARVAAAGPMPLDRYMELCLVDPEHGYYARRAPFGAAGDFVTAPEISQMFGELLGLWAAQVWVDLGRPTPFRLVELGPGSGALMADALRAGRAAPGFGEAAEVWFVEASEALGRAQRARVPTARHAAAFAEVPDGPLILLANEFFDALPIRQFVRRGAVWRERAVDVEGGRLRWTEIAPADPPELPEAAPEGAVLERCAAGTALAAGIGGRLARAGGAALIVDYGAEPPESGGGDTLQALSRHRPADPLAAPGAADLTAHVDFAALRAALRRAGAVSPPPATQGALLRRLGLVERADALARARPARAGEIAAQRDRLAGPDAMGALFKALAARGPRQPPLPGFVDQ